MKILYAIRLALVWTTAVWSATVVPREAFAGFVPVPTHPSCPAGCIIGSVQYYEAVPGAGVAGTPIFDNVDSTIPLGNLVSAGSGHPNIGPAMSVVAVQTDVDLSVLGPSVPGMLSTAQPATIGTGSVFDAASVGITTLVSDAQVSTSYSPVNLSTTDKAGGVAVIDAHSESLAMNTSDYPISGPVYSYFAFRFGLPHSGTPGYAAFSLTTSFFTPSAGVTYLDPIVIATDGFGPLPDVVQFGEYGGLDLLSYDAATDSDVFVAWGVSLSTIEIDPGLLFWESILTVAYDPPIWEVAVTSEDLFDLILKSDPRFKDPKVVVGTPKPVPEPGGLALVGLAAFGIALALRRQHRDGGDATPRNGRIAPGSPIPARAARRDCVRAASSWTRRPVCQQRSCQRRPRHQRAS